MSKYLIIKAKDASKTYTAKDSVPPKPYLRTKDGYFPLTSKTSTGNDLQVKVGGLKYKIVETYTTSIETTTTSNSAYTTGITDTITIGEYSIYFDYDRSSTIYNIYVDTSTFSAISYMEKQRGTTAYSSGKTTYRTVSSSRLLQTTTYEVTKNTYENYYTLSQTGPFISIINQYGSTSTKNGLNISKTEKHTLHEILNTFPYASSVTIYLKNGRSFYNSLTTIATTSTNTGSYFGLYIVIYTTRANATRTQQITTTTSTTSQ